MIKSDMETKRKVGRPAIPTPVQISLKLSADDLAIIDEGARAAGMNRSPFLVLHAKRAAERILKKQG